MTSAQTSEPSIIVIFGGRGDLSRRKLLPALARLRAQGQMHAHSHVLAIGRSREDDDESFRELARKSLTDAGEHALVADFCGEQLHYHPMPSADAEAFQGLCKRIEAIEEASSLPQNRIFYLALPPKVFAPTIVGLGEAGLADSLGFTRLVIEKPFGKDLESAQKLNATVHRYFAEKQVYRIDHYLGKDPVQNLLVLRFANAFIEALWNRTHVHSVQITAAESLGVGTRAGYYEGAGAMRDMVQNHLTQLLALVAMEPPVTLEADAIRQEKIKVLRAIAPLTKDSVVRGQYRAGHIDDSDVVGYLDEDRVAANSTTETFVALRVCIDNWRWQGVPFYLRTGKRMPRRLTQIAIRFQDAPVGLFKAAGTQLDTPDVMLITLQPDEGFSIHMDVKVPGSPLKLARVPLAFQYSQAFERMPEAYQTLLHDVLAGDQTLFVHGEEVEASWRVFANLLDVAEAPEGYAAGSWGPAAAENFAVCDKELWRVG